VPRADLALENMVKWLKPGGLMILHLPERESVPGFYARILPFWTHVWAYRHLYGKPFAGQPGHAPYPTSYHPVIGRKRLRGFLEARGMKVLNCNGHAFKSPIKGLLGTLQYWGFRLTEMLSFGNLTWKYKDIVYIAVKDFPDKRNIATAQNEVAGFLRRNMARISVLMPVYNVRDYVAEALASIQSQTFADLEIVIVDDGSTDGTLQIVEQIASSDPRISIIRVPRNLGLTYALNIGLPYCHAPFIARMDGDDIALPTRLEKQLRFLEENPGVALVGCASIQIDKAGRPIPGLRIALKPAEEDIPKTILLNTPCLHIWLARRELYDKLDGYREMRYSEDYDFLLRAWTAGFRLSNLAEPLMQIRSWPGNMSSCLETRKAHYYIRRLCRERMKNGCDSFSKEVYDLTVKSGKLENILFRLAHTCAQRGLLVRHSIKPFIYIPLAAMLSTWQARYYFDSIRLKLAWPESMRST
jgi:glycosyltransferase involved in cell wall biosynthesis